jgi:hypothetical protein
MAGCPLLRLPKTSGTSRPWQAPVRVAAEHPDVVPYPLQGRDLVEQSPVGRGPVDLRETLDTETVVEGHDHDSATGQVPGVVFREAGVAHGVTAAGDPHHHREPCRRIRLRCPDVDRQPVDAGGVLGHPEHAGLRGWRTVRDRRTHTVPAAHRLRCGEPEGADRRLGERDAAEDRQARLPAAAEDAGRRTDFRLGLGRLAGCGDGHFAVPLRSGSASIPMRAVWGQTI